MKFSILIPTHDQRDTVVEAVASALAQEHGDFEVVVSDDASTDGTPDVVAALPPDPRLSLHRGRANVGRVANYRRCLYEFARGDYVLMLDGDDVLVCRDYLSRAERLIDRHHVPLVFGRVEARDAATGLPRGGGDLNRDLAPLLDGDALFLRLGTGRVALLHLGCVYDRRRAIALDFYRADILSSDFESLHRLIIGAQVGFVDVVAGVWRRHEASAVSRARPAERLANLRSVTGPYEHALASGRFSRAVLRRWLRRALVRAARPDLAAILRAGDRGVALAYLREVRRWSPAAWVQLLGSRRVLRAWPRALRRA